MPNPFYSLSLGGSADTWFGIDSIGQIYKYSANMDTKVKFGNPLPTVVGGYGMYKIQKCINRWYVGTVWYTTISYYSDNNCITWNTVASLTANPSAQITDIIIYKNVCILAQNSLTILSYSTDNTTWNTISYSYFFSNFIGHISEGGFGILVGSSGDSNLYRIKVDLTNLSSPVISELTPITAFAGVVLAGVSYLADNTAIISTRNEIFTSVSPYTVITNSRTISGATSILTNKRYNYCIQLTTSSPNTTIYKLDLNLNILSTLLTFTGFFGKSYIGEPNFLNDQTPIACDAGYRLFDWKTQTLSALKTDVISIYPFIEDPTQLVYTFPSNLVSNVTITNISPSNKKGAIRTYNISSGTIPPGLTLNSITGIFSGTPTTVGTYTFVVSGSNIYGSTSYTVSSLSVNIAAPVISSYSNTGQTFTMNSSITVMSPTVSVGPTSYSISPALPTGISLNTTTGVISGTPTVIVSSTTYDITATNAGGASSPFPITFSVNNQAVPVISSYSNTEQTFTINTAITVMTPTVINQVINYSVSPPLPNGLSINISTGVIGGTPSGLSSTTYNVIATNAGGNSIAFNILINVVPSVGFTPTDIAGLQFWFDGQDATTTNNGISLTGFKNKVNGNAGIIENTVAYNTTLGSQAKKSYTLSTTNSRMYVSVPLSTWTGSGAGSYFTNIFVCLATTSLNGGFNRWMTIASSTTGESGVYMLCPVSNGGATTIDGYVGGWAGATVTFNPLKPFIMIVRQSSNSSFYQQRTITYNDGATPIDSGWVTGGALFSLNSTSQFVYLGTPQASLSQNISYGEAMTYNSNLTNTDITNLISYFRLKYEFN